MQTSGRRKSEDESSIGIKYMVVSQADLKLFYNRAEYFSNMKLHSLDQYWSNNNVHPFHQQIHEMIESILIKRGEKTIRLKRLDIIRNFEKSLSISNPMGRFSAKIISYVTKLLMSRDLKRSKQNYYNEK